jgi:hypothetical protein
MREETQPEQIPRPQKLGLANALRFLNRTREI